MQQSRKLGIAGATVALTLTGVGTAAASAADDDVDDRDVAITGSALGRASAAARRAAGGGRVTETESNDEEAYYEVEVTLDDGTEVDVHLDASFNLVGLERDEGGDHED